MPEMLRKYLMLTELNLLTNLVNRSEGAYVQFMEKYA